MAYPLLLSDRTVLLNGRQKRGLLDMLPCLPLDILCEIFCFLYPADLLVLARTSKSFRSLLLNASSAFIWRFARRNIAGLPEPPADMNEVQYASFVFGSKCHYKGCNKKARDIVWHLRIRSCASCRSKHRPINVNESGDCLAIRAFLQCFPDALEQYIPYGPFLDGRGNSIKGFQAIHVKSFKDELYALPDSERQACLDRCRQATDLVTQFSKAGVAWQLDQKNTRITELRNKRAARAEIIRDCLMETGFKEEIDYFGWGRIRKHPLISSTQTLTDKARSTVLDQVRGYMLGWRELRMEEKVYGPRRQTFFDAWLQFTTTIFHNAPRDYVYFPLPPSATVGFFENINSIIRQTGPVLPETLLGQLHDAFYPACDYIIDWHRTTRRELASLLPDYKAGDDDEAIHAQLKLATSIFQCDSGLNCRGRGRALTYPEVLSHPCFTLIKREDAPSRRDPKAMANHKARLMMGGSPWSCSGRIQVHPRQHMVNKVLLCCGKDLGSTTTAEMDEQDPRLVCVECAAHERTIIFMCWRRAVQHGITCHPDSTLSHPWKVVFPNIRVRIRTLESKNSRPLSSMLDSPASDYSICLLCPPRIPSWNTRFGCGELLSHIRNRHGVPNPVLSRDYIFDRNITPVYPDSIKLRF